MHRQVEHHMIGAAARRVRRLQLRGGRPGKRRLIQLAATTVAVVVCLGVAAPYASGSGHSNGRIVFTRTDDLGNQLAYTVNPDGSGERLLFSGAAGWAHWSPDGRSVDVRHDDGLAATIVDADDGTSRDLAIPDPDFACGPTTTDEQCEMTDFTCPAWSPDGSRLACTASSGVNPSRSGIYTIRSSDGGGLRLVQLCPPACGMLGEYSPDGTRLEFTGPDADGQLRVFRIKLDGTHLRALTPPMAINDEFGGSWSRHGHKILFAARPAPDHRYALWSVKSDGTGLHRVPVASCGGALSDPDSVGCQNGDWSPDGTMIVFTHVTAAGIAVCTANLRTRAVHQTSPVVASDSLPDWGTHELL